MSPLSLFISKARPNIIALFLQTQSRPRHDIRLPMSRFTSRKCGRQRFTPSNLGCFLCPPEMTPSLLPLSLLPFHPIVEKLHFRGLLAVSHPIPPPLLTSDSVLLRFTANVYCRRRHSDFARPPPITSGVVHSRLEMRAIVPQSIVPCSKAWTDRQTKMGVGALCNRQPLRLVCTNRHVTAYICRLQMKGLKGDGDGG